MHELIGSTVVEEGTESSGAGWCPCWPTRRTSCWSWTPALVPIVFVRSCSDGVTVVAVPEGLFDPPTGEA